MSKKKPEQEPKKKPPSRERYEAENTTISIRVTRDLRERLRIVQQNRNQSIADLLRECLEVVVKNMYRDEVTYRNAYQKGYDAGYADAKERFGIPFHCQDCGEVAYVEKPEDKAFLSDAVEGFEEWTHAICPNKKVNRVKDELDDEADQ